jgi:hypothetical protein
MLLNLKNATAIKLLIMSIVNCKSEDCESIQLHCRTILLTCFLMEIEPFCLPLSENHCGTLSQYRKGEFYQQYLALYLDCHGDQYKTTLKMLEQSPRWKELLDLADEIIDSCNAVNTKKR